MEKAVKAMKKGDKHKKGKYLTNRSKALNAVKIFENCEKGLQIVTNGERQ